MACGMEYVLTVTIRGLTPARQQELLDRGWRASFPRIGEARVRLEADNEDQAALQAIREAERVPGLRVDRVTAII